MSLFNKKLKIFIYFFTFIVTSLNAQISEIQTNVNPRAEGLIQILNSTQDSLILKNKTTIYKVEIFNTVYSKKYETYERSVILPIDDIPLGRYAIAVFVDRKIIMLTLLRHKEYFSTDKLKETELIDNNLTNTNNPQKNNPIKVNDSVKQIIQLYWVIEETNPRFGSWKRESLLRYKRVIRKINKNKHDIKTITGKFNRLTVYEIYDVRRFVDYGKISGFNPIPFYKTSQ